MISVVTSLILVFIAIAFVATIISAVLKMIFFFKQQESYRQLLKFGLLGEVVGLIAMLTFWLLNRKDINNRVEAETIIAIPFFSMLAGQVVATTIAFRKRHKN